MVSEQVFALLVICGFYHVCMPLQTLQGMKAMLPQRVFWGRIRCFIQLSVLLRTTLPVVSVAMCCAVYCDSV